MAKQSPKPGRRNWPPQTTRHHMVPRCRCRLRDGQHRGNVKKIPRQDHEAWHTLFGEMMPHEVVAYIVITLAERGYFNEVHLEAHWEGATYKFDLDAPKQAEPIMAVRRRFNKVDWERVFGTVTWFSAATQVVRDWSPAGYFSFVNIVATPEERYAFFCGEEAV